MPDLELFQQSGYTNDIPTGSQLNDRLAAAQTGGNPKNITWSKLITWFNSALSFLKLDWSNFNSSYAATARTKLSVSSTSEIATTYSTKTELNQVNTKLGGLAVVVVGIYGADGNTYKLFGKYSLDITKLSTGRYKIAHNANIGAHFFMIETLTDGLTGKLVSNKAIQYVSANEVHAYFADDASENDPWSFKVIMYSTPS